MFELHQLRCFVAVALEMNFHRGAERLNMTQPPVSRQVQILERQLGVALFDRSGRSIRLTAAGDRFLIEARDLLRRAEDAKEIARSAASGHLGNVSLAFIPAAAAFILPRIACLLSDQLPGVQIVLNELLTDPQLERLRTGQIDLGILRRTEKGVSSLHTPLFREPYRLAIHKDHPYASRTLLDLEDLDGQDMLMYSPGAGWYGHGLLSPVFRARNVQPNFIQHLGQGTSMLALVDAGQGMALIPDSLTRMRLDNVVIRPIRLPPETMTTYHLVMSEPRSQIPAVQRVYDTIAGHFGTLASAGAGASGQPAADPAGQ